MANRWDPDVRAKYLASWPGEKTFDGKPFGQGQCASCGLLARRGLHPKRNLAEEVPLDDRLVGQVFTLSDGAASIPWCLVRAADLVAETQARDALLSSRIPIPGPRPGVASTALRQNATEVQALEMVVSGVLYKQRGCPEWWPYREFQSPAEHRQERDMMRLEQDRADLQVRLSELERTAGAEARRVERKWTVLFAVFALAAIAVQLFYPDGIDVPRTLEWLKQLLPWN